MIRLSFEQQTGEFTYDRWEVEGDDADETYKALVDLMGSHLWVPRWSRKFAEASATEQADAGQP